MTIKIISKIVICTHCPEYIEYNWVTIAFFTLHHNLPHCPSHPSYPFIIHYPSLILSLPHHPPHLPHHPPWPSSPYRVVHGVCLSYCSLCSTAQTSLAIFLMSHLMCANVLHIVTVPHVFFWGPRNSLNTHLECVIIYLLSYF